MLLLVNASIIKLIILCAKQVNYYFYLKFKSISLIAFTTLPPELDVKLIWKS